MSLHNGGGTGWGEAINGGFGLVADGTDDAMRRLDMMLRWDVNNGVARRAWAGNRGAVTAISRAMQEDCGLRVTLPEVTQDQEELVASAIAEAFGGCA